MRFSFTSAFVSALVAASAVYGQSFGPITCEAGTGNTIQKADLQAFVNDLNSLNTVSGHDNPLDLRSLASLFSVSSASFNEASFVLAVKNKFVFASTHVSFTSLAGAVLQVMETCCGDFPTCIGGSTQVLGDTGLNVDVIIKNLQESPP